MTVTSVSVSPVTFVTLYPPPANPALSLGLPSQQQFSGKVLLSNQHAGGFQWIDKSGGKLNVDPSGLVSVLPSTPPGMYEVDFQANDDPNRFVAVTIQVLTTSQLDVTVN